MQGRTVRILRRVHDSETVGSNPILAIAPTLRGASFQSTEACARGTPLHPTRRPLYPYPLGQVAERLIASALRAGGWNTPRRFKSGPVRSTASGDYRHSRPHVERPTPTGRPDPRQEERGRVGCDCKQCISTRVVGVRVKTPVRARNPQGCAPCRWRDSRLWQAKPLPRLVDTREADRPEHSLSHLSRFRTSRGSTPRRLVPNDARRNGVARGGVSSSRRKPSPTLIMTNVGYTPRIDVRWQSGENGPVWA